VIRTRLPLRSMSGKGGDSEPGGKDNLDQTAHRSLL